MHTRNATPSRKPRSLSTKALAVAAATAAMVLAAPASGQDSDGDTLSDADEIGLYLTDPFNPDTDGDGLDDDWEILGVPWISSTGVGQRYVLPYNNGQPWLGARRKTIYVEADFMSPHFTFGSIAASLVEIRFGMAPNQNPDGSTGIDLVVIVDDATAQAQFSYDPPSGVNWPPEFASYKMSWFGTASERSSFDWLAPGGGSGPLRMAKLQAFRYVVFGDRLGTTSISGIAELPGNDMIVTLGGWWWGSPPLSPSQVQWRQQAYAGTFMHELGHTLGLRHGGFDSNVNFKPNYHSVMNYSWTVPRYVGFSLAPSAQQLAYEASWNLDFTSGSATPLDENMLSETNTALCAGCGPSHSTHVVPIGPAGPWGWGWLEPETTPGVDFDRNGFVTPGLTSADLNFVMTSYCSPPQCDDPLPVCPFLDLCPHTASDDWANIAYPLGGSPNFQTGAHGAVLPPGNEIDLEIVQMLSYVGSCQHAEGFEAYPEGAPLEGAGGWTGWDANPAFAGTVAASPVRTGERSLEVAAAADQVHEYCSNDASRWVLSVWQYVPASFENGDVGPLAGSFIVVMNTYEPGIHEENDWSAQVQFDGTANLVKVYHGDGLDTVDVPLVRDRWVRIQVLVDLEEDWTTVYYDDQLVTEYPWTGGVLGGGGGAFAIAAVDLYANGSTSVYYDDISFAHAEDAPPCAPADLNCDQVVDGVDLAIVLGTWGPGGGEADLDGDGIVGAADLAIVLGAWTG